MVTKEELDKLRQEYEDLTESNKNAVEADELKRKIAKKKETGIGAEMRHVLEAYGLRRSFYLWIFGLALISIGKLFLDYFFPASIIGFLIILLGVYFIPLVKKEVGSFMKND